MTYKDKVTKLLSIIKGLESTIDILEDDLLETKISLTEANKTIVKYKETYGQVNNQLTLKGV